MPLLWRDPDDRLRRYLDKASKAVRAAGQPVLPSNYPVAVIDTPKRGSRLHLVVPLYAGVGGMDWKTGKMCWYARSFKALEVVFDLGQPSSEPGPRVDQWLEHYAEKWKRADAARPLDMGPLRRISACHLAYASGLLVVPTNAGIVLGVDPDDLTIVWAHTYDKGEWPLGAPVAWAPGKEEAIMRPTTWRVTAPMIHEDKVLVAAPDSDSLTCLRLSDGKLLWKVPHQKEDLFPAGVIDGKVLVVGTKQCRALSMTDGKTQWTLDTGMPSGQGAASGSRYYLPLSYAAGGKGAEVCVLDVAKGTIVDHIAAPKNEVPGNLMFLKDILVSVNVWEVVGYPIK
jgi:hypothetical protein